MMVDEFSSFGAAPSTGGEPDPNAPALPNMDDLFEQAVNMSDVRQTQADALKPAGSYVTIPTLTVQAGPVREGVNAGRFLIRFFGPAALTVTEKNAKALDLMPGTVVKGQFGFGVSPVRANKLKDGVDTGEPDNASKLWAMAVETYKAVYKQVGTIGDVVKLIQNYPVVIRVIQVGVATDRNPEPDGEPGNIVMAISPVREQRA
mgnify:FL=1